jgi:MFS family permease
MAHEFGGSREAVSAIFSITACIYFLLGPITGHLADRFGPRPVVATGAIAMGAGLVATAYAPHLRAAYFTYGLGVGVAVACCYVPTTAMIGGWFLRRRNSALGIVASGIGVGTLAIAPLAAELIKHFGWRDAYMMLGLAASACLLVCALIAERPPVELGTAQFKLRHAMRTPNFLILYVSGMLATLATSVPFVFLAPYAESIGIGEVPAATLVGIIGLAGTAGRLGLGALADRFGIISLFRGCILALALSYGIWLGAHSWLMLAVFAIAMGASYGGAVALMPAVMADLFGTQGLGVMLGALYTNGAIGTLIGPPLCGAIIDRTGSYLIAIGFTLIATIAAFVVLLWLGHPRAQDGATAS